MASAPDTTSDRLSRHEAELLFEGFIRVIQEAARDAFIGERLALADTTVQVHFTDTDPELSLTLLCDRAPIEVVAGGGLGAEVHLHGSMARCAQFMAGDLHLAMAIARGDVTYTGPIRKVLRAVPILRRLFGEQAMRLIHGSDAARLGPLLQRLLTPSDHAAQPAAEADTGKDASTGELLAKAVDYEHDHGDLYEGALQFDESVPGEFWSVRIEDTYKSFGPNRVMDGLKLGIPDGMITLVLGPSGTGKSVLINHLIGLMFPDAGDILVHGESVNGMTHSQLLEMRKKFGILFQDGALFGSMNVFDNVAFPLREHTDLSEDEIGEVVNRRLADVGLTAAADRMPGQLSGGMRKRAGFARALVLEPEIVIFDEPDSGLDPVRTALLGELIKKMHAENGGTYIVITHDTASVRQIGEYIAVLWKGRIVLSGAAEDMWSSENPFVRQFLNRGIEGPLGME